MLIKLGATREWGSRLTSNLYRMTAAAFVVGCIGSTFGCSGNPSPSAIDSSHPASLEPASYPNKHDMVYALTLLLTDVLKDIETHTKDASTSQDQIQALRSLHSDIEKDLVFALPFVSKDMDHGDQLRVMNYLFDRRRYFQDELRQIME